jgi:amidohydrolase
VLVRTDMDALPVEEETGLPYASKVTTKNDEGKDVHVMHACGHDAHIAAFIGTARALQRLQDQWQGTILFVAQPAEETGNGARALLKAGLYDRFGQPNFALGFHDKADMQTGHIGVTEGYTYANVDSVDVTVRGAGGHGAYPHKTKDPIVLAAEMIDAWQTIASRENNPLDPIVVTVGSIHGGTKHNIISDEVKMQLTVRTYKADVRERVLAAIDRIAKGCATAAGVPPERAPIITLRKDEFCPATYNNPGLTKQLVAVWKKSLGNENVEIVDPTMGGEDFSEYSLPDHSIPAVDFHIGAVDPVKVVDSKKTGTPLPSLHSSKFAPVPEPTIRVGVVGMTAAVLELTKKERCHSERSRGIPWRNPWVTQRDPSTRLRMTTQKRLSLHLDVLSEIGWDVEIFAFDDGRLAFFKASAGDRLELQNFLFRLHRFFDRRFFVFRRNRFLLWRIEDRFRFAWHRC